MIVHVYFQASNTPKLALDIVLKFTQSMGAIYALGLERGKTVKKIALLTVHASDMSTEINLATVILLYYRSHVLLVTQLS